MEYVNLFANCQLVKGANRSLICDLQLQKSYPVSNDVYDVLHLLKHCSIEECIAHFGADNKDAVLSYIEFVLDKELGFIESRILSELVPLDLSWDAFSEITNVIIEYNEAMNYDNIFFKALINLNVHCLEIRCYHEPDLKKLVLFLDTFNGSILKHINLVLPYAADIDIPLLENLVRNNLRIKSILIHSASEDKSLRIYKDTVPLHYFSKVISSCMACGLILPYHFITNMELFAESQQHNTCLNRKLSIDFNGFIKNCPSMPDNYGNMLETDLDQLLENKDFRKYWSVRKDEIAVCKDCEFRHVCTDCRAYIENPQDFYSKPLKCGYNPYTNEWSEWSTNPIKQKAMEYYKLQDLVKSNEA